MRRLGFRGLALVPLVAATPLAAQQPDPAIAHGRHGLSLSVGLLARVDAAPQATNVSGVLGGVSYRYWSAPDWSVELGADVHDAEVTAGVAASVASLLVGANWHPEALAIGSAVRPYLGVAAGPYLGSESDGFRATASVRSVLGARVGGGFDAFPSRWFRLGARAAYHVVPEFDEPVGSVRSARGPQFSLELGVLLGSR
jgi:hypothetical protein